MKKIKKGVSHKFIPAKMRERLFDIVGTTHTKERKEDLLRRLFEQFDFEYSQDNVKQIYYDAYKAKGGYRSIEEYTDWIFNN